MSNESTDGSIVRDQPLKLGFIGGGLDSAVGYVHYLAATMEDEWTVLAGCFAQNPEVNRETARSYGVPTERTYQDWQKMLENEKGRIDAIVVLTPTPMHCEIVTACLNSGYPVICEKALAATSKEVKQIIEARDSVKGFLAVTYNYTGYPMVRELKEIIRSGKLGRILHFQAEMPQEGFIRLGGNGKKPSPQTWRLHDGDVPTIYLDLAVHLHSLISYLTGEHPIDVVSDQDSFGWCHVIDNVMSLCRYTGGIHGQLWFSKASLGCRNGLRIRVFGTDGSAEWLQTNPEELQLASATGRRELLDRSDDVKVAHLRRYNRFKVGHPSGFIEAFTNHYCDIAKSLREYRSNGSWTSEDVFGADFALEGLEMAEAMVRASKLKSWQTVKR